MAEHRLTTIDFSSIDSSIGSWDVQTNAGDNLPGQIFAINAYDSDNIHQLIVEDEDATPGDPLFEDDDTGIGYADNGAPQTLVDPVTMNGIPYAAGVTAEAEYRITFTANDGNTTDGPFYEAVAVKLGGTVVGLAFIGAVPPTGVDYVITSAADSTGSPPNYNAVNVPYHEITPFCFTANSLIRTAEGDKRAASLKVGDLVYTRDNGLQPIRWIGVRKLQAAQLQQNPKIRPIRIRAGALGDCSPASDLIVSPQHRILLRSKLAQSMFSTSEVLVAAKFLCALDGVEVIEAQTAVTYVHFLFDRHEIVYANGTETESLFIGPEALKAVGPAAVEEIISLFPELAHEAKLPLPARPIVQGKPARNLASMHLQQGVPVFSRSLH